MAKKNKKKNLKNFILFILMISLIFVYSEYSNEFNGLLDSTLYSLNSPNSPEINFSDSIKIASWNIQNFGQSKANNGEIMNQIGEIVQKYDIIAIQEITNVNEKVDLNCDRNQDSLTHNNFGVIRESLENVLTENFKLEISPQVYNERYLFIYDSNKVKLVNSYFVNDTNDGQRCLTDRDKSGMMLREPYIGIFDVNGNNVSLMNVHTSPSNNHDELIALKYFYDLELNKNENLLLLGDLNFGCSYYPDFNMFNESIFIFDDNSDTNVASSVCAYDRMIYNEPFIGSFVNSGIDNLITNEISDHYLIWTEIGFN